MNQIETDSGIYSWEGPLTDGTMVTLPDGAVATFYSIVSLTNGVAYDWFEDYLQEPDGESGRDA